MYAGTHRRQELKNKRSKKFNRGLANVCETCYAEHALYHNTIKGHNNVVTNYTAERQLTEPYATVTIA